MANFKSFPNERAAGQQGDLFCRGSVFFGCFNEEIFSNRNLDLV